MDATLDWYWRTKADEKQGPLRFVELRDKLAAGGLPRTVEVWSEGMPEWQPATRVAGLVADGPSSSAASDGALRFIVPVGRSGLAIAAGYLGILSLVPGVGLLALVFAGLGARDLRRHPAKRGWGRVVFGGLMGLVTSATYGWVQFGPHKY